MNRKFIGKVIAILSCAFLCMGAGITDWKVELVSDKPIIDLEDIVTEQSGTDTTPTPSETPDLVIEPDRVEEKDLCIYVRAESMKIGAVEYDDIDEFEQALYFELEQGVTRVKIWDEYAESEKYKLVLAVVDDILDDISSDAVVVENLYLGAL